MYVLSRQGIQPLQHETSPRHQRHGPSRAASARASRNVPNGGRPARRRRCQPSPPATTLSAASSCSPRRDASTSRCWAYGVERARVWVKTDERHLVGEFRRLEWLSSVSSFTFGKQTLCLQYIHAALWGITEQNRVQAGFEVFRMILIVMRR